MDMCMYCKNSTTVNSTTTHVVNYKNCIIVIKNVPCLECEQCGEKYYTDEVAERLETIVNMAKKLMQEIAVIDYPQVASLYYSIHRIWRLSPKKFRNRRSKVIICQPLPKKSGLFTPL